MASNIPQSTLYYDCEIKEEAVSDLVGKGGDIEGYRRYFGRGIYGNENEIMWITDRTPHEGCIVDDSNIPENLKNKRGGYWRQFFRVVCGNIGLWYQDNSTANVLCPLPKTIKVMKGSKFLDFTSKERTDIISKSTPNENKCPPP